nr:uncharacterized protein LOC122271641 [Parasteatoda tepidariorum]
MLNHALRVFVIDTKGSILLCFRILTVFLYQILLAVKQNAALAVKWNGNQVVQSAAPCVFVVVRQERRLSVSQCIVNCLVVLKGSALTDAQLVFATLSPVHKLSVDLQLWKKNFLKIDVLNVCQKSPKVHERKKHV